MNHRWIWTTPTSSCGAGWRRSPLSPVQLMTATLVAAMPAPTAWAHSPPVGEEASHRVNAGGMRPKGPAPPQRPPGTPAYPPAYLGRMGTCWVDAVDSGADRTAGQSTGADSLDNRYSDS